MYRGQQRGEQHRIGGIRDDGPRKEKNVEGKKCDVSQHQPGGGAMRYLRRLAAPQANPFVEHGQRSKHAREQVQLAGADQRAYGGENQKEQRRAKEALGWERGQLCGKWNGGHDAKVYGSTR